MERIRDVGMRRRPGSQVDVVEAQYRALAARVAAADDFAEAQRAHRSFLAALTAQSFLDLASVSSIVEVIMQLSSALCAAARVVHAFIYPTDRPILFHIFFQSSTEVYTRGASLCSVSRQTSVVRGERRL